MSSTRTALAAALSALVTLPALADAQDFTYQPPGQLEAGTSGRVDDQIYVPGMRYPIENAPSYANSQVYGVGGSQGPSGGQCDARNFSYPWWDNYCEPRQWDMPLCPSGTGHQGQDIRAATCDNLTHGVVAAEDGQISSIGSYSVNLMTPSGTRHRYLHMGGVAVSTNDQVTRGQRLGLVSNEFGGTPTTIHLHYDIQQNVSGVGTVYVPTYMSLVSSYEELLGLPGQTCEPVPAAGATIDNQSRCFRLHGPSASWRYVEGPGNEGDLYWTYAWNDPDPGNWAEWLLEFETAGTYRVEINTHPDYAMSQQALWDVVHAGGERTSLTLDLAGSDGWVEIGEFAFDASAGQSVAMYDNTGEEVSLQRKLMADAVRITPVAMMPPADMGSDMGGTDTAAPADTGGDDTATASDTGGSDTGAADTGGLLPDAVGPTDTATSTEPPIENQNEANGGCACRAVHDGRSGRPVWPGAAVVLGLIGLLWTRRRR